MWHDMVLCTLTMTFVLWWFYRFGFDFSESHVILIKTFIIQKTFIFIHFLFYPALYVSACVSVCGINNRYYKIWKFNFPFLCILEVVGGARFFIFSTFLRKPSWIRFYLICIIMNEFHRPRCFYSLRILSKWYRMFQNTLDESFW